MNKADTSSAQDFNHSPDYRSIVFRGKYYTLTSFAAQAMQILHEQYRKGVPEVSKDYILEEVGSSSKRLRDIFQCCQGWREFVIPGEKRGTYKLNMT